MSCLLMCKSHKVKLNTCAGKLPKKEKISFKSPPKAEYSFLTILPTKQDFSWVYPGKMN